MSDHWYTYGFPAYLLLRTGMPEQAVRYGIGNTYAEAVNGLTETPIQSTGRDGGVFAALRWLNSEGTIDFADIDVPFDPETSVPRLGDAVEHDENEEPDGVQFILPPENSGQIVEVSYGWDGEYIYERAFDKSDRTTTYSCYELPVATASEWDAENDTEAPEPEKSDVNDWDTVAYFVRTFPDDSVTGEGACDVEVQVGAFDGVWFLRTTDDAGGDDDCDGTVYSTRSKAEAAAAEFAADCDEGDGEVAEEYLARKLEEQAGDPDPDGTWCVYWTTVDDEYPEDRYPTRDAATAACEIAQAALVQHAPGGLLCGYSVAHLVDGKWAEVK